MAQRPELLKRFLSRMNPPVFLGSAALVIGFVLFGTLFTDLARQAFDSMQSFIVNTFGWFYILSVTGLLGIVLWLLFSRYGDIRLGGEDARPEFSYLTWFSMMMSAGMGIGVVFFGVAEPMLHYLSPPMGEGETAEAVREAMRYTFFHWGLQ